MKPPNWDRIRQIFDAALALPREERRAFVTKACAGDLDLLREVTSLLAAADALEGFLETPIFKLNAAPNLIETTIGERYLVKRELGRSNMSHVYFALDQRLQLQPVVIKVLSQDLVQDPVARQRLDREVEALLRSDHTGVVRVLDRNDLPDGRPYIVMQYIEGEVLRSQIPPGGMDLDRAASILSQTGDALDHIHEKQIFHRDLKPENIMLKTGTDSVVLIDFGIAKVQDSAVAATTAAGLSVGTLVYMSPEQLRGERVTAVSDIYSMAVVAYEMVTGYRPFNPSSASHLLDLQRKGVGAKPASLRPSIPSNASDVIVHGLSYKPSARYQKASQFGGDIASALTGKEVRGYSRMDKRPFAIAGILIVLALLSYGVYRWINRPGPDHSSTNNSSIINRSFAYWLTVQQVRDGKDYRAPEKSNGEETFGNGDKFQLSVESPVSAYVYVFNEGSAESGDTNFRMIYPNQITNDGSAALGPNQPIQFEWMTFPDTAGTENFWFVWSLTPVPPLESAKTEAFKHPRGGLTDQTLVAVKEFLRTQPLATIYHYKADQTAKPRGKGDMLVALAQFKHR